MISAAWPRVLSHTAAACAAVAVLAAPAAGAAADYPSRPIRVVVPYPAGGGLDLVLRAMTPGLTARLGQQLVVDNRGGATGVIGAELVARAAPDGYTLLFHSSAGMGIVPNLNQSLPYDPVRDFAPVTLATSSPYMLVVHPKVPVTSVPQLIAYAKARPGELNYASSGNGSSTHLAGELLNRMAGTRLVHVPYKGAGPAVADTVAGHIQLRFSSIPPAMPHVKAGRLRALAVTGAQRFVLLPDLPAMAETVPGFQVDSWLAVFAPSRTPATIIRKLNAEIVAALHASELKSLLETTGVEAVGSTPERLGQVLREELARWAPVIKGLGIRD
jgi:tripartite-type tricarboxylate transporter receptor subunit TctC